MTSAKYSSVFSSGTRHIFLFLQYQKQTKNNNNNGTNNNITATTTQWKLQKRMIWKWSKIKMLVSDGFAWATTVSSEHSHLNKASGCFKRKKLTECLRKLNKERRGRDGGSSKHMKPVWVKLFVNRPFFPFVLFKGSKSVLQISTNQTARLYIWTN